jgi:hypothetical protein
MALECGEACKPIPVGASARAIVRAAGGRRHFEFDADQRAI